MKGTAMIKQLREQVEAQMARYTAATERLCERRRKTSDHPPERESDPDDVSPMVMDHQPSHP